MYDKICPMLTNNSVVEKDGKTDVCTAPVYCLDSQCAWWSENNQCCSIPKIADGLSFIGRKLK